MSDHPIFFVGRRVRIRLSPECDATHGVTHLHTGEDIQTDVRGHDPHEEGRLGCVGTFPETIKSGEIDDHPIAVWFSVPYHDDLGTHFGGAFAPHELIPLDADGNEVLHPALARFER